MTEAWTPDGTCDASPAANALSGPAPYHPIQLSGSGYRPAACRVSSTEGGRAESFGCDAAGNLTSRDGQRLSWDELGRLSEVSSGTATTGYVYDATGARLIRHERGVSTLYLGGQEVRVVNATGAVTATRYYTHAGATVGVRTATGLTWLAGDHHGTEQVAIDAAALTVTKRRFDPFGSARGTRPVSWPDEKGFVGGALDGSTGLTHLGAREYDPGLGRFISVDPILDPGDPQQLNAYAYSNNNPTSMSDPDGLKHSAGTKSLKKNTGKSVSKKADRQLKKPKRNDLTPRGCPPDRDCRSSKQKTADAARDRQKKARADLAELMAEFANGEVFDPENAKEFFDRVGRLAEALDLPFKSASICVDGEGGAIAGGAVSVCLNVDAKGVTVSGMIESGWYYGAGASAAVRVRVNSKAADEVDVGHTSSATRAVEWEFGGFHYCLGVEKHDPLKPGGQVSGFLEFGLGTPGGINFGSFMTPLDSFNSGYIDEW